MARRNAILAGVVVLALILTGLLGWWLLIGSQSAQGEAVPAATQEPATTSSPTPTGGAPVPDAVVSAIQSLPASPQSYLSTASPVRDAASSAFPSGTKTEVVDNTWSDEGEDQGLVQVTISRPDKPQETYAAMMVMEDGQWKVLGTVEVQK